MLLLYVSVYLFISRNMVNEGQCCKSKRSRAREVYEQNLCLLVVVSTSSERSKRQTECIGFGKEEEEAAEAEVLERWPEKDNLKECQCHKRGPMAHRVKSGKRKKLKQKVNIYM